MTRFRSALAGLGLCVSVLLASTAANGSALHLDTATAPTIATTTLPSSSGQLEISTGHQYYRNSPTFDVYRASGASGPLTALVMIHGGGWKGSDGAFLVPYAERAALEGNFAVFSINYRLDAEDPVAWADELHDVQAAIRTIVANADVYKVRTDGVLLLGDSAGGNLATLISSVGTVNPVKGAAAGGARDLAVPILGVAAWSPPTDLAVLVPHDGVPPAACSGDLACDFGWNSSAVVDYLGCEPAQCPEAYAQASPLTWVSAHTAPSYVAGGTSELVPLPQITSYVDRLTHAGVPTTSVVINSSLHATELGPWLWPSTMAFLTAHTPPSAAHHTSTRWWRLGIGILVVGMLLVVVLMMVLRRRRR